MTDRLRIALNGIERDMTDAEQEAFIATLPVPSPPAVPREVTNFQARALLKGMPSSAEGRSLFDDVDDALRAMGGIPWQAWEYTTTFPRDSALIAAIAAQLLLNKEQIDQMFIAAAAISV